MPAEPTWFGPIGRPLAGWIHTPDDVSARGGVLICPPVGLECSNWFRSRCGLRRAGGAARTSTLPRPQSSWPESSAYVGWPGGRVETVCTQQCERDALHTEANTCAMRDRAVGS